MSAREQAVHALLTRTGELGVGDRIAKVAQLSGGWSRHSFVATVETGAGAARRYVVRVKPPGTLLDTDLTVEYEVYASLQTSGVAIPQVFGIEESHDNPFGGPFFVMAHVEGDMPNVFRKEDRRRLEADWQDGRAIAGDMVDNLVRIHTHPTEELPTTLPRLDFQSVVARWRSVYEEKGLVRDPVLEEAYEWVAEREPPTANTGLVHGDYRVGNVLVHDGRVSAILDWELSYVGDVRFDLGYAALARFAGKHLRTQSDLLGSFADEDWFFEQYARRSGTPVGREVVRTFEMLGLMLNFATQMTGIWMHATGRTEDFRMAWARFAGPGLRQDMVRVMGW
jgi:aminoglycoside phosphotransferase (APT) family kinase protein